MKFYGQNSTGLLVQEVEDALSMETVVSTVTKLLRLIDLKSKINVKKQDFRQLRISKYYRPCQK